MLDILFVFILINLSPPLDCVPVEGGPRIVLLQSFTAENTVGPQNTFAEDVKAGVILIAAAPVLCV